MAPGIGAWAQQMMVGGAELGALGLARAYAAHVVVLPLAIALVLWARGRQVARHGWADGRGSPRLDVLAPGVVLAAGLVVGLCALAGATRGAPLDAPADPTSDYPARPEWFLLPLFEVRKLFHGPLEFWGTQLVPAAGVATLVLLPFFDRSPRTRALGASASLAVFGGAVLLIFAALRKDAADPKYAKQRAAADARTSVAVRLAMEGVPQDGALAMMRRDPELRGRALFEEHCASCHVLGDLGDPKEAAAAKLDGWGTPEWIASMIHDPDAPAFFGRGPYRDRMPSVDVRTKDTAEADWTPMVKSDAEKRAIALFLAAQGDEAGDPPRAIAPEVRALGEKIVSERCSTCHLYKGDGDDEGSGIAPELARYGSVAWTRAQVANPATAETYRQKALDASMKKHMPRFDRGLSAADVETVARWTRAHARGLPVR
jgi:ubiquinol-cytochrome c reductase cytochrome b subunit